MSKTFLVAALLLFAGSLAAHAQTSPGLIYGQVPTAAQWNSFFTAKQDYLGSAPCLVTGCVLSGELITVASASASAGLNIPPGAAPASPVNGDFWSTSAGFYGRAGGVTYGPLVGGGSSPLFTVPVVINLNAASAPAAQTGTALQTVGLDGATGRVEIDTFAGVPRFTCVRKDGTNASPTTLQSADEICSQNAFGYNGTAVVGPQAALRMYAAQNWSVGANGTYMRLGVTVNGGTTITDAISIENDGGVTVSPGTVTGGSKGTGTINVATGYYVNGSLISPTSAGTTGTLFQGVTSSNPIWTATPTLGASGTLGSLGFGNATSGIVTINTVTGALGTVTASLPANTGIIAELNFAQTWTAAQTFTNSDIKLLGSSTGATTFTSANAGASNFTATIPANTGTVAELNIAQTWTAAQTIQSASASALAVGLNGATNPAFVVNASTASQAAGLSVTGAATGGTVAIATIDSGAANNLTINALGTGTIGIGSVSTGRVTITPVTTITGALTLSAALNYGAVTLSNSVTGTGSMVLSSSPSIASLTVTTGFTATGLVTLADLATQTTNTVLVNATSGTASPTAQSVSSCSAANDALIWTTNTGFGCSASLASLTATDQTLSGGTNVTSFSIGTVTSGTTTIDCGKSPLQYMTNGGASTIAAPSSDGSCVIQITNNGSAGAISFSGFTVNASYTGAAMSTTNTSKYMMSVTRVNGSSIYNIIPQQ